MLVDPKHIVRRLSLPATHALEASVQFGSSSGHPEVGPEHLLVALLELDECDVAIVARRLDIDRSAVIRECRAILRANDSSGRRRPVFAESLFRWLEDAWTPASLEFASSTLRTGHLLLQLLTSPQRYLPELPRALGFVRVAELRQHLAEWTAQSPERSDAALPLAARGSTASNSEAGELERFTHSLTDAARRGAIDPICGRDAEIYQIIEVLARRRKNNPVIVGEPGVGKTALVEGLALSIIRGDVPPALAGIDLRSLDLGLLQAGAGVRGEFERRLCAVIDAVRASPTPIVLFIDEAHTLISPNHDHDAANLLKPALARGELRTIAATTWREFKKYFEKDPALERRFQPVRVDEPSLAAAAAMLRNIRPAYEKAHGVLILDAAIDAAVQLSHRYIQSRLLPDKAIDVLDTTAARVQLEQSARPSSLAALDQELAAVDRQIAAFHREEQEGYSVDSDLLSTLAATRCALADRASDLASRWQTERAALAAIQAARANTSSDGLKACDALRDARAKMRSLAGDSPLVHAEVDADAVARVVATMSGVPVERLHRSTVEALLKLEATLAERIKGQHHALEAIAEALRVARAGIQAPERPLGVFLFVGTSGVGKTETALALAELIFGGEQCLTIINMSEFQASHTVSRLVGSPPGYVGYGEGGTLTEAVRKRPYSVVLLDECEKAHLDVLNLFYQVFDKGTLADGEGRAVDFRNTIIILTSNLASDELLALAGQGSSPTEAAAAIRPILAAHFKPALLARMTVVPFMPLDRATIRAVAELKLDALARRVHAQHEITTTFAPELSESLAERCVTVDAGARELDHILRASLMPRLGAALLSELIDGGVRRSLAVGLGDDGEWRLTFH